jgi:hypothetical protein
LAARCLADHWRESYVAETGKSMKAGEFPAFKKDDWRKIPISLKIAPVFEKRRMQGASFLD